MDALSATVDEVALEGLDGITIPSLWIRLQDRKPKFPLQLDPYTKDYIWKSLVSNNDLEFFELPEDRDDVVLFDRLKCIDPDTGIETAETFSDLKKDIYPIHIVAENKHGIQGSCAFFSERKNITRHVRSKSLTVLLSLEEAMQRHGRKLVVVASQALRFRCLIGPESDPSLKLADDSYCILERIGRARWQGELQTDLHGLCFKTDARKFHYLRKVLVRNGLLKMQAHVRRQNARQQQHTVLLLLNRFNVIRRSKYDVLMECLCSFLQQAPRQTVSTVTAREHLNVNERTLRRLYDHMRAAKLIEITRCPLEEIDPSAGTCFTKKGDPVKVVCLKLLKPYKGRSIVEDDDDEEEEDEAGTRASFAKGRIMERDMVSQAYDVVVSTGTKGISQSGLGCRLNVGKLEFRMLCRKLERDGAIKGFMEDVGRQRTTKYISHRCVGVSNHLQMFAKEQERKELFSSAPQTFDTLPACPETPTASHSLAHKSTKSSAKELQRDGFGDADAGRTRGHGEPGVEGSNGDKSKAGAKSETVGKTAGKKRGAKTKRTRCEKTSGARRTPPAAQTAAVTNSEDDIPSGSESLPAAGDEGDESIVTPVSSSAHQAEVLSAASNPADDDAVVVEDLLQQEDASGEASRSHMCFPKQHNVTYRVLKRKNLIVEAVRNFKIIESLFQLQKLINDAEKQDGVSTKCCRKTILRHIQSLSREGLLKMYTTTVIQDGISKKVEMIVHPSIQPRDDIVKKAIEQVRYKISTSITAVRQQQAEEKAKEQRNEMKGLTASPCRGRKHKSEKNPASTSDDVFKPVRVKGIGKTLGFQPKMHRLGVVHSFLWYLIHEHPLRDSLTHPHSPNQTPGNSNDGHPAERSDTCEKEGVSNAAELDTGKDARSPAGADGQTQSSESGCTGSVDPVAADSPLPNMDATLWDAEEEMLKEASNTQPDLKVYSEEDSWKKFIPPIRLRRESDRGWAVINDLILCLPLSIFLQVIQINYKVDGLDEYVNDPVKHHYLVRVLPIKLRMQLLHKRKYVFSFYENLQRLAYMGLLQFGPVAKFKEKDQGLVCLRRNATIVDTTSAEPHYCLVTESPDGPFPRRHYTFNAAEDVESFWFDLMCVCLNTPLGIVRSKRGDSEEEAEPSIVRDRAVFPGLAYLLKGSKEVCDDGKTPGDGKGAAGLDSEFFAHLKRNWFWTSHLLLDESSNDGAVTDMKSRLKSGVSQSALKNRFKPGELAAPMYVTNKRMQLGEETVEIAIEPATRNQQVVGGKRQKRKRSKKEVVKVPRKKKKESRIRTAAHDEADHQALKMMTARRVSWSVQEDALMMLCSVASYLLNTKLKRPFIPHCVVRDLLQAEFQMSRDKTSLAVGRRKRYILKNPQTLLNYRICLAEVHQDKALMDLLEEKKPANPERAEDCAAALSEYTRLLRQKFRSPAADPCDTVTPNTKQQILSRFKVCAIDDGKRMSFKDAISSTADIHAIVLNNLIQSSLAMTNYQMRSCRSFQTFHTYNKYNEELLCQVFVRCRKTGLVNRRRVDSKGLQKKRALPILPMSYQLSQSYYRCFSWRFPRTLCTELFRFTRNLTAGGLRDERPATAFFQETESRTENGEDVSERTGCERRQKESKKKPEGQSEVEKSDAPEDGEDDQHKAGAEEKQNELNQRAGGSDDAPSVGEQIADHLAHDEEQPGAEPPVKAAFEVPAAYPDVSDMLRYPLDSLGGSCVAFLSLMTLGLLSVHVSIPKQIVVVDSNLVDDAVKSGMTALDEDDEDDDDGEECESRKRMEVKAHQASHTKYLMMRGYCCPGIVKMRNLNTNDNIVVDSCILRLQLRSTRVHHLFTVDDFSPLALLECGPSLLPSVFAFSINGRSSSECSVEECDRRLLEQRGYSPQDLEACAVLRSSLEGAGEKGVDLADFYQVHGCLVESQSGRTRSLRQYMQELEEEGQVLRVGGLGVRWVLVKHADPWLLTVNPRLWSQPRLNSDGLPFSEKQHRIPFKRKRYRRVQADTEEPPAKKASGDGTEMDELSGESTGGKLNEGGNKVSERWQTPGDEGKEEEAAAQEKTDTEETHRETREQGEKEEEMEHDGEEKARSPPAAPADPDYEESSSFISRPWRMVDGMPNRQVCKGMLEGVLCHIMSFPGLTQRSLMEHYKDVLQPVVVLDLVQALMDLGCVRKRTLVKGPKPSLFSGCVSLTRREAEVMMERPDGVFYEPTISCCLRLARVLPNERHWNHSV